MAAGYLRWKRWGSVARCAQQVGCNV